MAKRLIAFEPKTLGRKPKYPWGEWSDGSVWCAEYGEDFDIRPSMFAQSVYSHANRNGCKARVRVDDSTVTFQIVKA